MKKGLVFGVGINDADYTTTKFVEYPRVNGKRVRKRIWICPYYSAWRSMLKRVYCNNYKESFPSYETVDVCKEWHRFSVFRSWMETQDWEGKELDKDLLSKGGKVYSPTTCCFISKQINMFMTESSATRGQWPIGVCFVEATGKFRTQCRNPFLGKQETVGNFSTPEEAFLAWKVRKLALARMLAESQSNPIIAKALVEKYENY